MILLSYSHGHGLTISSGLSSSPINGTAGFIVVVSVPIATQSVLDFATQEEQPLLLDVYHACPLPESGLP